MKKTILLAFTLACGSTQDDPDFYRQAWNCMGELAIADGLATRDERPQPMGLYAAYTICQHTAHGILWTPRDTIAWRRVARRGYTPEGEQR